VTDPNQVRRPPPTPAPGTEGIEGVVVVDKGLGMTSHDVVAAIRRIVGSKPGRRGNRAGPKVGHAGTLDPDASGVLVVCIGRATRLVPYLQASMKTYDARMRLGRTTTTLDAEGEQTSLTDASAVTEESLCEVLKGFVGDIEQIPPMVSAVKVDGERLYEKARRGEEVARAARPVTIHDIVLADFVAGPAAEASFLVTCSAGTYIRTLAADVGDRLDVGAHLTGLRRLGSGRFAVDEAHDLDALREMAEAGTFAEAVMTPAQAMADLPSIAVDAEHAAALRNGRGLDGAVTDDGGIVCVTDPDGDLVAVMRQQGPRARPEVVFN
jgi:tRNA pseudouridine55 synthase